MGGRFRAAPEMELPDAVSFSAQTLRAVGPPHYSWHMSVAAAHTLEHSGLALLDGGVPGAWAPWIARTLHSLWTNSSTTDRVILFPLGSFLAQHEPELAKARFSPAHTPPALAEGSHKSLPVGATLLRYQHRVRPPVLTRLTTILVAVAIETGLGDAQGRRRVESLAMMLRGAFADQGSQLRILFPDTHSIPALVQGYEAYLRSRPAGDSELQGFNDIWNSWLRDTLLRWIRTDPLAIAESFRSPLAPSLDAATIPVGGHESEDGDSASDVAVYLVERDLPSLDESPRGEQIKAEAGALLRSSHGDLMLPMDQLAPPELVSRLIGHAMASAREFLRAGDAAHAEPPAALSFSVAAGLREMDLPAVVWGGNHTKAALVVDTDLPVLYRKVFRPPNAVVPSNEMAALLASTTDVLRWPLPPSLHAALKALATESGELDGRPVLPLCAMAFSRAYRLWDVVTELAPESGLAPTQVRLALASEIARTLGTEVSQLALADTFSMSAAPAYYSAPTELSLAVVVSSVMERWFGEGVPVPEDLQRTFGSLLVLRDEAARTWPDQLRHRIRSGAHRKGRTDVDAWVAHRDHLAAALCAVTGSRPTDEVGRITLDQVIPEYGLVVLRDKASDVLRLTRIAATGNLWMADLRLFLNRIHAISASPRRPQAAQLAHRILRGEAPLFSVPDGVAERGLTAAELTASMPALLRCVPNHYRHRLNQKLARKGVDPELRHAQLGWVVSPAHAMANLSHWSAKAFGAELAGTLDETLVEDEWYLPGKKAPAWSWEGLPARPAKDWEALAKAHKAEHQDNVRRLRKNLSARWDELSPGVVNRLAQAFAEYIPMLAIDVDHRRLTRAPGHRIDEAVELTRDDHALIWERVRQGDQNPHDALESVIARILLNRLVRNARKKGMVKGPDPSRPYLRVTSEPSPFLPELGLAVRHAEAIRKMLLERAWLQRSHDEAPVSYMVVLAFSPYRDPARATAAVAVANAATRSSSQGHCLRLPANVDGLATPMVMGGLPALVLARRGIQAPKGRAPSQELVESWLRERLEGVLDFVGQVNGVLAPTVSLFRAAGRLELSGQERLALIEGASVGAVPVERSLARDDKWPLRTATPKPNKDDARIDATYDEEATMPLQSQALDRRKRETGYAKLTALLTPEGLAKIAGGKSDGHYAWRGRLKKLLAKLRTEFAERSNLGLLTGFVMHRLQYGGAIKSELQHVTLGTDLTRFSRDLLEVSGGNNIIEFDEAQFQRHYLAVLLGKSMSSRRQAFDALMLFHGFLVQEYQVEEQSFAELEAFAGQRVKSLDPGFFTLVEKQRVFQVLEADLEEERSHIDANPKQVRCLELRKLLYLVLEASAIRPRSAHGLTLGDLCLSGEGRDFVRVRLTGEYGHAKTPRSTGFIPLTGELWEASRDWVVEWLDRAKVQLEGTSWWTAPIFAIELRSRRRFGLVFMTRRIDRLLKWVSSNPKACTYWLRKSRITERLDAVLHTDQPLARDVYAALRAGGHADIDTPLASYVGEPAIVVARHLRDGLDTTRSAILAITGLDAPQLDMAWQRGGADTLRARFVTALARVGSRSAASPMEVLTQPPPLRRAAVLVPRNIHDFASSLRACDGRSEAILRAGISSRQADALDAAARTMLLRRGTSPWQLEGLRASRSVLALPRRLEGTNALFALLDTEPGAELLMLANAWLLQANLDGLHGPEVMLELADDSAFSAAQWLIAKTQVHLELGRRGEMRVLQVPKDVRRSMSHAAAFRWLLAVTWLHRQATIAK